MAEYICRDDIVLHYDELAKIDPNDFVGMAKYFAKQIRALPAADVEPVRHGRWGSSPASIRSVKKTNIPEAVCLLCRKRFCDITNSITLYRFCPNCGAKMDKEA